MKFTPSTKNILLSLSISILVILNLSSVHAQKHQFKLTEFKICQSTTKRQLVDANNPNFEEFQQTKNKSNETSSQDRSGASKILLPLTNMLNIHYDTELYFGKNKQPFKLVIDTGSTALWIPDVECTNCKQNNLWKLYNCDKSSTCQAQDKQDQNNIIPINYGVGSISGYPVKDNIYLSDKDQTGFEYEFLLVTEVTDFKVLQIQGILGLGRDENSEFYNQSILGSMMKKGVVDQKVFSLFLSDSSCLGNSVLVFGGYNEDYIDGDISYIKVNTPDMWSVEISSASLVLSTKEQSSSSSSSENNATKETTNEILKFKTDTVIIDSGTTKIVLPKSDLNLLIDGLKLKFDIQCELEKRSASAEILTVVCAESDQSKYPSFQFTLGSTEEEKKTFELTAEDYIETCFYNLQVRKCALRFQYIDIEYILLGDTFLRKYYTIFDMEKSRIGFATAKIIQPKPFYETNIFSAYIGLAITIGFLLIFLFSCKLHTMWQDHVYEKTHSLRAQPDSPPNTTGPDDLHQRGNHIEMQQGTNDQSLEDPNDMSEEISQDDISDIDSSQNKQQQSYRLPIQIKQ